MKALVQCIALLLLQVRPTASQRRKLKQLHWDKIKAPQEGTIWHQSSGLNPNLNFAELESLFQARHLQVSAAYTCTQPPSSHRVHGTMTSGGCNCTCPDLHELDIQIQNGGVLDSYDQVFLYSCACVSFTACCVCSAQACLSACAFLAAYQQIRGPSSYPTSVTLSQQPV